MSEGLYPPESRSPLPPREMLTIRARITLADLERHIAAVKAGGTGEGVALAGVLSDVQRRTR